MKKCILLLIAAIMIIIPLNAENASWFTAMEPGYFTESGTLFADSQSGIASDNLPMGSVVELSNPETGRSTVTTVIDTLPELPEGRTIAVTEKTADLLGMLDSGLADLKLSVIREGTINKEANENTGWYYFDLGVFTDTKNLSVIYNRLIENNLRPYIEIEDSGIHLYVRHILTYQIESAKDKIALSGIEAEAPIPEPNPYS